VVVYATCSPVLAETAGVVTAVLEARADVVLEDAGTLLPDVPGPHPRPAPRGAGRKRRRRCREVRGEPRFHQLATRRI